MRNCGCVASHAAAGVPWSTLRATCWASASVTDCWLMQQQPCCSSVRSWARTIVGTGWGVKLLLQCRALNRRWPIPSAAATRAR